jgi:serine/threonine protein phosphatase PrpC
MKVTACRCGAGPDALVDGYCEVCGRKWGSLPSPQTPSGLQTRDHVEVKLSEGFAGVTDRGLRHKTNEDDFAIATLQADDGVTLSILVVCDGVSSSDRAQEASAIAATTTCAALKQSFKSGMENAEAKLGEAIAAANTAVCGLVVPASHTNREPPETTIVTAVVQDRTAVLAWVGDSRAYWIDGQSPEQSLLLTHDHSWMNDVVDSGQMTEAEAQQNRLAHAITRCLGVSDDPEGSSPSFATFSFPPAGGILLLCSDGLWNYASAPLPLATLVRDASTTDGTLGIARTLISWANTQGGHDNITAVLLVITPENRISEG